MKKQACILILCVVLGLLCCGAASGKSTETPMQAPNDAGRGENVAADVDVDELLDKLELGGVNGIVGTLGESELKIFGFSDIVERIKSIARGEIRNEFPDIVTYVLALCGADVFEFMPMLISCLAIALAYNVINSIKSRMASDAIGKVVYFATGTLAVTIVVGYFSSVTVLAVRFVGSLKTQINAVAPVLITLMTAAGATSSAGVYAPSIAILGSGMTNLVTMVAFPALLMGLVFDIIGSVANGIKLDKTAEFFRSACKWLLSTAFFLFVTTIGVSGITASVGDGISLRAAKFAVSKYVPVVGGYLSQGFDFVMSGNVLIKNALGSSAVVLIVLCAAPVVCKLAVFTLTLRLTAAIAEPLGGEKMVGTLSAVAKSSSLMSAVVFSMTFLYILFLTMTICTGNLSL